MQIKQQHSPLACGTGRIEWRPITRAQSRIHTWFWVCWAGEENWIGKIEWKEMKFSRQNQAKRRKVFASFFGRQNNQWKQVKCLKSKPYYETIFISNEMSCFPHLYVFLYTLLCSQPMHGDIYAMKWEEFVFENKSGRKSYTKWIKRRERRKACFS